MEIHEKKCEACEEGVPPLTHDQIEPLFANLNSAWEVVEAHHLQRKGEFGDFADALKTLVFG